MRLIMRWVISSNRRVASSLLLVVWVLGGMLVGVLMALDGTSYDYWYTAWGAKIGCPRTHIRNV